MHSLVQVGESSPVVQHDCRTRAMASLTIHKTHPSVASPKLHEGVAQGKPAMILSKHFMVIGAFHGVDQFD